MMYNMNTLKNKFISFTIFAIITYSASFIGSLATFSYKEPWYSTLNKSVLTPPDWVFAPVWTTLYLFMAIAIWSAWHKNYNINLVLILIFLFVLNKIYKYLNLCNFFNIKYIISSDKSFIIHKFIYIYLYI